MTRYLALALAVGAFGAFTASDAAASNTLSKTTTQRLRSRRLDYDGKHVYCDSIACHEWLIPIPNARTVECDDGACSQDQCCEGGWCCWRYACPDGFRKVEYASQIRCDIYEVPMEPCCEYVGNNFDDNVVMALNCNSVECSEGSTLIDNANEVECYDYPCEESQCCEAFCSYYVCPENQVQIEDAEAIKCLSSGCTTDLCCE